MNILQDFVIVEIVDFKENLIEQFEWELDDELLDIDIDEVFDDKDEILDDSVRFNEVFEDFIAEIVDENLPDYEYEFIEGIISTICISFIDEDYNLVCTTVVHNIEKEKRSGFSFDFTTYDFRNNVPRIKVSLCDDYSEHNELDENFYNDEFDEYDDFFDEDDGCYD